MKQKPKPTTPFSIFGKTVDVPLNVFFQGKFIESSTFDDDLWVERGEETYALSHPDYFNKKILVVYAEEWRKNLIINGESKPNL